MHPFVGVRERRLAGSGLVALFLIMCLWFLLDGSSWRSGRFLDKVIIGRHLPSDCGMSADFSTLHAPVIYFVTPTHARREQVAELTRLSQTLMHVSNLVWVLSEDAETCSELVAEIALRSSLPHVRLARPMPQKYKQEVVYKTKKGYKKKKKKEPRGVANRNAALDWIANNATIDGVVYFGDDDNTYDLRLFDEIRSTQGVSLFPVGLLEERGVSGPIINGNNSRVIGFTDPWFHDRVFPIDMAGFAVTVELIRTSGARMSFVPGAEENDFLQALGVPKENMEAKAANGTLVLVWHTQSVKKPVPIVKPEKMGEKTNLTPLLQTLEQQGTAVVSQDGGKPLPKCLESHCPTYLKNPKVVIT